MTRLTEAERAAIAAGRDRDRDLRARGQSFRSRGVVHTPAELARYVARATDAMLRTKLRFPGGIADRRVAVVDPACGPGVFLAAALAVVTPRRVRLHGPPRAFVGLDVDAEAIVDAERVLRAPAEALGFPLELRVGDTLAHLDPFSALDADTAVAVIGNPPWAVRTANRDAEATTALLEDFRRDDDGARLDEKKLGVLSDDYVRFFRWSAEIVRGAPSGGVVALVTNGSFLDGVLHRGMRAALTRWFDGIDVVDLGGSALVAQSGMTDENVFGVRPSVAITVAWREPALDAIRRARVRHVALSGTKSEKLARLDRDDFEPELVRASPPLYLFRPEKVDTAWTGFWALDRAMPFHAEGVQTNRDEAVIDRDYDRLLARLHAFARGDADPSLTKARAASEHYDPEQAREAMSRALDRDPRGEHGLIRRIAYRPHDDRFFATVTPFCHRPRPGLLAAIDEASPVLLSVRKDRGKVPWTHFAASRAIPDNCFLSTRSSCRTRAFPVRDADGRENLDPVLRATWGDRLGLVVEAIDFVRYALAVLASPRYRARFDDALHLSYPRIPEPRDAALFREGVLVGEALVRAFTTMPEESDRNVEVAIGHHRVRSGALARAITHADEVAGAILGALD